MFNRLAAGSQRALAEIIATYHNRLYAYVFRYVRDAYYTENILQDTFLELWQHRYTAGQLRFPEGWLFVTAVHKAIDHLRREKARNPVILLPDEYINISASEDGRDAPVQKELNRQIEAALSKLPPMRRKVMELHMQTDLSRAQIGEALGIGEETVKSHLTEGRNQLSNYLKKNGQLSLTIILWIIKILSND